MSWPSSALVAVILAVAGAVGAFWMASLAVDWLRIPAREGEAGYFAVLMGLLGIVAGAVVGLVVSRYAGGAGFGGFARGLGSAAAVLAALIGAGGLLAWMQYDPVPMAGGRGLMLEVEVRGPRGMAFEVPAGQEISWESTPLKVWLGAHGGGSASGELRFAEAKAEGDRRIIPGTIRIVTSKRSLYLGLQRGATDPAHYITVEMPRPLDPERSQWSDWRTFPPDPAAADETGPEGFAVRYRLVLAPQEPE